MKRTTNILEVFIVDVMLCLVANPKPKELLTFWSKYLTTKIAFSFLHEDFSLSFFLFPQNLFDFLRRFAFDHCGNFCTCKMKEVADIHVICCKGKLKQFSFSHAIDE